LGTNDGKNAEKEIFQTELSYLVSHLRTKYGEQMPIVFPIGYTNGAYNTAIPAIIERLGGENARLYACKLSFASAAKEIGGDGIHPNLETAAVMAQELTAFLKSLLNL
jgi:lysophospholipase L1-like esterase